MKKLIIVLGTIGLCCSCGPNYTVTGDYGLLPGDSIYLFAVGNRVLARGVAGADSTFTLQGRISQPDLATLIGGEFNPEPLELILERGIIRIGEDPSGRYTASNTPLNDSLRALEWEVEDLYAEYMNMPVGTPREQVFRQLDRARQIQGAMIGNNLDNILGLKLFSDYEFSAGFSDDAAALAAMKSRMDTFSRRMQKHPLMQKLRKQLGNFENIQVGKPFTDLALKNRHGETISLSSVAGSGKWVLLDFWATWCGPCMDEMPHLQTVYADYKERGFEVYAISLDNDKTRWAKVVTENEMPWINVLGVGDDMQSDAAALYCIRSIPANFLISPDGVIAAKNLRGKALHAKLAEVIK